MSIATTPKISGPALLEVQDLSVKGIESALFFDVNFILRAKEVLGVIGPSGSGKSTLLRTILGYTVPETGKIVLPKKATFQYVPQELDDLDFAEDPTIENLMLDARGLLGLERSLNTLEEKLLANYTYERMQKFTLAQERYDLLGGLESRSRIAEILAGVGLPSIPLQRTIHELSSGQRRKIFVARALYAQPDILIFDEPTAHLDVRSVEWLKGYLKKMRQAAIIATNNQSVLREVTHKILEITANGRVLLFEGALEKYQEQKQLLVERESLTIEKQQTKVDQLRSTVARFKAMGDAKSKKAARRRKVLERRADRLDETLQENKERSISETTVAKPRSFSTQRRSGTDVLTIQGITKTYTSGKKAVSLEDLDLYIQRGQRLAIVGPNGSGKSTLLRLIYAPKEFPADTGVIEQGASTDLAVFLPDFAGWRDAQTLFQESKRLSGVLDDKNIRSVLAFWGFTGNEVYQKPIRQLTVGEKSQLQLAIIMLQQPNLLLLDEPTGNLSLEMKNRLALALNEYDGTLLVVSHEEEFLQKLHIDTLLALPRGRVLNVK